MKILTFATKAMTSDEDLWHCYCKDFIASKLKSINVPYKDEIGEHNFFKNLYRSSYMLESSNWAGQDSRSYDSFNINSSFTPLFPMA